MKALVLERFGSPSELRLLELTDPQPGPGQIRIAVWACGTNPVDAGNRADGSWAGLRAPCILGYDLAGVVDAVAADVVGFAQGDRVMAMTPFPGGGGAYAELVVVEAAQAVALGPTVGFVQAAATPLAGGTALAILERLALRPTEKLLMLGASGGVGAFLIPLAAAAGLRVLAVGSASNHAAMLSAGAEACIDYTAEDVAERTVDLAGGQVDGIADLVGDHQLALALSALKDHGVIACIQPPELDLDPLLDHNLTLHGVLVSNRPDHLSKLAELLDDGSLKPRVSHVMALGDGAQAHAILESRHSGGKIVLLAHEH